MIKNKNNMPATLQAVIVSIMLSSVTPMIAFAASPSPINLGSASSFVILSKSGVSTTGVTSVIGDIGVSPVAASYITGFSLSLPVASPFSTSPMVTGKVYASDYANPTGATLTTAVLDMQTAYTDGVGRPADVTELGAGNIGGLTLAPGTYKWGTGVIIPTDVTISGGANDVWIFQIAQTLTVSAGVTVHLTGGAKAENVFWVVGGQTTIGTTATLPGTILDQTAIVLSTGARLNGRALAQTAVTLDASSVTLPSSSAAVTLPVQPVTPTVAPVTPIVVPVAVSNTVVTSTQTQPTNVYHASNNSNNSVQTTAVPASNVQMTNTSNVTAPQASLFGQQIRSIASNLSHGSKNNSVRVLQEFLISQNKGSSAQALGRNGSTAYFGPLTRAALAEYQSQVGIYPAAGYFGPITRAYININN